MGNAQPAVTGASLPGQLLNAKEFALRPYEEIIDFIASLGPREIVEFQPSEAARQRVWDLIERQKAVPLSTDEKAELDHYLEVEHLMRLAKARARLRLAHGQGG